jgi:plastocyanin
MRHPRTAAFTASLITGLALAAPAAQAAPATVNWQKPTNASVAINQGEAVTWNVVESGHNIDVVSGPESWKSTSGKDPQGAQVTHVFNAPGTYTFICDYHSNMQGTITVAKAAAQPGQPGQPAPAPGQPTPAPGGGAQQPTTGGPAGPAGDATASKVDAAAPTVKKVSVSRSALRVRLSEAAKLTVRYRKAGAKKVSKKVVAGRRGTNVIKLGKLMRNGRYSVSVVATDAAGNASKALRLTVRR